MKKCFGALIVIVIVLLSHTPVGVAQTSCKPPKGKPGCVCQTDKGTIDLRPIAHKDGTP